MYQTIIIKNNQLSINCFNTQKEAYDFIFQQSLSKYKVYGPNEHKRIDFLNSLYGDEAKKDFCVDFNVAKEIVKNNLRMVRNFLFEKLDLAFLKAIETNDEERRQYIVSLKDKLRNITDLEFPNTEQELFNFIPPVFKEVYDLVV